MITEINNSLYDQFIADFEERAARIENESVYSLRKKAMEQFKLLGFPSTKVEDWKYTNVMPFLSADFTFKQPVNTNTTEVGIQQFRIAALECYQIVLLNGEYQPQLSDEIVNKNISVTSLKESYQEETFQKNFGQQLNLNKHHFGALNTAFFKDGLFITTKDNAVAEKPLHIIYLFDSDANLFIQPRHLFVFGKNSNTTLIETYVAANVNSKVFINSVSEITMGENASLHHYNIQTPHDGTVLINHTEVNQKDSSCYNNYCTSFPGADLIRNNLNVALEGENIGSHLYGLYLVADKQLIDNHTLVDHRKPHCQSNELYKGVMKENALGVFNGKVLVRKDAQKTNAFQQNNNLMLSSSAVIESKPQLEIFADDVKCSHGSTVGRFNEDALFYLRSRGISEEQAIALLINAFVFDVTEKIPIPAIQLHINKLIEQSLNELETVS
ncbi:Fe-S cluster assembly protein SufD [Solitalea koreensis]|uniref:Iron-regulated ABC transporter permease protein SufD n=1 Tax=Solitalea koreensis TaxID=543615 RepID=A0A521DAC8_9SPHI|nr:Fe-S cluster assembly protein SufD [Solitalea koreensis]SMO68585.1 Iron-regulated ABC transporter permease protein SufD [Solitalea koreensis]